MQEYAAALSHIIAEKGCDGMQYDPRELEDKLASRDTPYIIVYPHPGIDIAGFTHNLQNLLNKYHGHNQGWTIGSNIEIQGVPLIDAVAEAEALGPKPRLH